MALFKTSVFLLLTTKSCLSSFLVTRTIFNGVLYEESHPRSKTLLYSTSLIAKNGINYWKNFDSLREKFSFNATALFCSFGDGGWLVYPQQDYQVSNSMSLKLLVGESCIRSEKTLSAQSLGPINKRLNSPTNSGLLTFSSAYFTSAFNLIDSKLDSFSGPIKSLIHTGLNNWTIEGYILDRKGKLKSTGVRLCLLGVPTERIYCGIVDIDNLFIDGEEQELMATDSVTLTKGCNDKDFRVAKQKCYPEGSYKIIVESEIVQHDTSCKKYLRPFDIIKISEYSIVLQLWQVRVKSKSSADNERQNEIFPQERKHLHDMVKNGISNFTVQFKEFLETKCKIICPEYVQIIQSLSEIVLQLVGSKMPQNELQNFTETINELVIFGFDKCDNESTAVVKNDSCIRNNYTTVPFVELFPQIFDFLYAKCSRKQEHKFSLHKWIREYLTKSELDWNMVYEVAMNGINLEMQETLLLKCFDENTTEMPVPKISEETQPTIL